MQKTITEQEVEEHALDIFENLGYEIISGPDIAPDGKNPERESYSDVVLVERLNIEKSKIPKNKDLWKIENSEKFIEERRKLMFRELTYLLKSFILIKKA